MLSFFLDEGREGVLQIGAGDVEVQLSTVGVGDASRLLTHYDGDGIGGLGNALCRAMAQAQVARNVSIMRNRQDAACTHDLTACNDQGAIVQGAILKENILDQARVDVGVDDITRALIIGEWDGLLDDNEGASLGFGHVHAGINHGQDPFLGIINLGLAPE